MAEGETVPQCAVCLDGEATAGVVHGDSMHKCLCHDCAVELKARQTGNCPICREPIDSYIMQIF